MHNLLNEFEDLSNRLEHLVSHSSQMVFISGEEMEEQSAFVEAFLGSKQHEADIVYLSGNQFHGEEDVRYDFAKQIVCTTPSIDLPLLQLVATREHRDLPLLIAVTRAERIPNQILQELWDLVLQTRFARNKQQINIILFGEQAWAEKTKAWLPTNNNDKPVLLTSETVEMNFDQEIQGNLDDLIKSKRKEFNERRKARALAHEPAKSVLANWWVKLLAICAFILCFSGLLIWQYFDLTQSAFKDFAQFLFQAEATSPLEEWEEAKALLAETDNTTTSANQTQLAQTQTTTIEKESSEAASEEDSRTQTGFVSSWKEESERLSRKAIPVNLPDAKPVEVAKTIPRQTVKQPESFNTDSGGLELSQAESLVSIPTERLKQLQPKTPTQEPTVIAEPLIPNELAGKMAKSEMSPSEFVGPPAPNNVKTTPEKAVKAQDSTLESTQSELTTQPQNIANEEFTEAENTLVQDYPVEDIVTVEELEQSVDTQSSVAVQPQPAYLFNEKTLLDLVDSQYLLQVSGMSSRGVLEQYLTDNRLRQQVWVYKTQRYGGDWFVVVYNKAFSSLDEARNSVNELPQTTRQSAPFAKSATTIKAEIAQGYPQN